MNDERSKPHASGQSSLQKKSEKGWALITGSSSGIGEEFAKQLAANGYHILLCARRLERLEALARSIEDSYGVKVSTRALDLTKPQAVIELMEWASAFEPLTCLVNNAGRGDYDEFTRLPLDRHLETIQLNVSSLVALTHLAANRMVLQNRPAHIINVASIIAYLSVDQYAIYGASKAFVKSFSQTMHRELYKNGITVTCVSPGGTKTEFMDLAGQTLSRVADSSLMDAKTVARLGLEAALKGRWHIVTGISNKLLTLLPRVLPESAAGTLTTKVFSRFAKSQADLEATRST